MGASNSASIAFVVLETKREPSPVLHQPTLWAFLLGEKFAIDGAFQ
jgi:hypothetical protein